MSTREALIHDIERQPDSVVQELQNYLNFLLKAQERQRERAAKFERGEVDEKGWPVGYFEKYYGIFANEPFERAPQPPMEKREEW